MPLYYFRAPTFDINPESPTAPRLGSIFPNLNRLTGPLNQYNHEPPDPSTTNTHNSHAFHDDSQRSTAGSIGLGATTIQGIGSLGLIFGFKRAHNYSYSCSTLQTTEFEPSRDFVIRCIRASQDVQDFVEQSPFGSKKVYMITGLKIASGFRRTEGKSSENKPQVTLGADASLLGIPAGGEVETDLTFSGSRSIASGAETVVFAYRAIKISPKGDDTSYKEVSGGLYSYGDESDDEEEWDISGLDPELEFPDTVSVPLEIATAGERK